MYQTYSQKAEILMKSLNSDTLTKSGALLHMRPFPKTLTLEEYHSIISRDNVIVIENPVARFDLITMKVESSSQLEIDKANLFMDLGKIIVNSKTETVESLESFFNESNLYFFYSAIQLGKVYQIRAAVVEKSLIEEAIMRYDAIVNINSNLSLENSIERIREYVNSSQFEKDKKMSEIPVHTLGEKYMMENQPTSSPNSNVNNFSNIITAGLPVSNF